MFGELLENVRRNVPLVHNITNYVTVNDVANIILAVGGSPIMADDEREVAEITSKSRALYLNLGTLNTRTIKSMLIAAEEANKNNIPVILDPVGAGFSKLRDEAIDQLLGQVKFSAIRGNMSEIKALLKKGSQAKGVDVQVSDQIGQDNLKSCVEFAKQAARALQCVIAISGPIDIVSDGEVAYCVYGGDKLMSRITGTGCQLTAMIATFIGANPRKVLLASVAAIAMIDICGEQGVRRMTDLDGNASLRNYIIDAVFNLTETELDKEARYETK
ncbi:hydroxyethylthiazole kinase [Lactobacillus colini]|uniref:Hydroxyethylthiazole kinase n=1 Tax=Lactobacillus colini TaxID=1819254 RepID=A0ABS4MGF8_9LACO|nr:hydroxyethylthiazole kinase [Lactobacillus colini]MBP2058758.1 hydroxyethylthiazole kinase [Lactobacillus colini]